MAVQMELSPPMEMFRFMIGMLVLIGLISIIIFVSIVILFFSETIGGSPFLGYLAMSSFVGIIFYPLGMELNKIMNATKYMRNKRRMY